jgi:hypothetical protein
MIVDVLGFFEDLGRMLRASEVSLEACWQSFGEVAIYYWEVLGAAFANRETDTAENMSSQNWSEFHYFVNQMREEDVRRDEPPLQLEEEDEAEFLRLEADLED